MGTHHLSCAELLIGRFLRESGPGKMLENIGNAVFSQNPANASTTHLTCRYVSRPARSRAGGRRSGRAAGASPARHGPCDLRRDATRFVQRCYIAVQRCYMHFPGRQRTAQGCRPAVHGRSRDALGTFRWVPPCCVTPPEALAKDMEIPDFFRRNRGRLNAI